MAFRLYPVVSLRNVAPIPAVDSKTAADLGPAMKQHEHWVIFCPEGKVATYRLGPKIKLADLIYSK